MDALELMLSRESALRLEAPAPSADELNQMFASAVRAPDHGRLRPWRFVLIDEDQRAAFGALLADSLRRRKPSASDAELQWERDKAFRGLSDDALQARSTNRDADVRFSTETERRRRRKASTVTPQPPPQQTLLQAS